LDAVRSHIGYSKMKVGEYLLDKFTGWMKDRALEVAMREIQKQTSGPGAPSVGEGRLFEVIISEIDGSYTAEVRPRGFGPTPRDAYTDYLARPHAETVPQTMLPPPLVNLPGASVTRQLVFVRGGSAVVPTLMDPLFSAALKEDVKARLAEKEATVKRVEAAQAAARSNGSGSGRASGGGDNAHPRAGEGSSGTVSSGSSGSGSTTDGPRGATVGGGGLPLVLNLQDVPTLEFGAIEGRMWADFDGDGIDDFCRIRVNPFAATSDVTAGIIPRNINPMVLTPALVTLSTGRTFADRAAGSTIETRLIDPGLPSGRAWVDFNRDGKADYARVVPINNEYVVAVTLSTGANLGSQTLVSKRLDPGIDGDRVWADWDGDGYPDFIRLIGPNNLTARLAVTFGGPTGFVETKESTGRFDWGYPESRTWMDIDGNGGTDFIRVIGNNRDIVAITLSAGRAIGRTITEALPSAEESHVLRGAVPTAPRFRPAGARR